MRRTDLRWAILVVLLAVVGGVGGLAVSHRDHPFSATASIVFRPNSLEESLLGNAAPQVNETTQDAATQVLLVNRLPVITAAVRQLGLNDPPKSVQGRVTAAAAGASNVVNVAAQAPSSSGAVALANAVATQFVKQQQRLSRSSIAAAQRGLAARLARLQRQPTSATITSAEQAVVTQQATLSALGAVNLANAGVIQPAVGAGRTGHSRTTLVALGIIVGLIVGLLLFWIIVQTQARRRVEARSGLAGFSETTYLSLSRAGRRADRDTALRGADATHVDHLAVVLGMERGDGQRLVLCAPADSSADDFDLAWRLAQASAVFGARTLYVSVDAQPGGQPDEQPPPQAHGPNLSTLGIAAVTGADLDDRLRSMVEVDGRPFDAILIAGASLAISATSLRLASRADSVVLFSFRRSPPAPAVEASLSALSHVGAPQPGFVSAGARPV